MTGVVESILQSGNKPWKDRLLFLDIENEYKALHVTLKFADLSANGC
jgi:hypothetical protein